MPYVVSTSQADGTPSHPQIILMAGDKRILIAEVKDQSTAEAIIMVALANRPDAAEAPGPYPTGEHPDTV